MNRRSFKQWLTILCLGTVALMAVQAQPVEMTVQAQPVELKYAPEDGSAFDVVETSTRVTSVTGSDSAIDSVIDVRTRESVVTVAAVVAPDPETVMTTAGLTVEAIPDLTEFSNKVTIQSQSLIRNGNIVASPLHAALSGLELTYHLDAQGKLLEISGYEGVRDAMTSRLPDKLAATLLKLVNHETLRHHDRASYEEVYGPFTGGSVTPVVNEVSAAIHALPSEGSVVLYAVSTITAVPDEDKIRLNRTFNSDAAALAMQFDGLEEATILEAKGMLESALPETYASATVVGAEDVLVQTSGALVEFRNLALVSEWTLQAPEGTTPEGGTPADETQESTTPEVHRVEETMQFTATAVEVPPDPETVAQP